MAALAPVNRFVEMLRPPDQGPTCYQFLEPEERARLAVVCRAARDHVPRPSAAVVREWQALQKECSPRGGFFSSLVGNITRLTPQQVSSILERASRSPCFFSSSACGFLQELSRHRPMEFGDPVDFVSAIVNILKKAPPKDLKSPGIQGALRSIAHMLQDERPSILYRAFQRIGPEAIAPGSPGFAVLERALTRRAYNAFCEAMRGLFPLHASDPCPEVRILPLHPHWWFGRTEDLEEEMPEVIQKALIGAVEGTDRPCIIDLSSALQSQIQPSYTRRFVRELAQNRAPIFVMGDAVLPTDERYIAFPLTEQAARAFARSS